MIKYHVIKLYYEIKRTTITIVEKQEMWDEFEPAAKFRNLELLDQALK